jgi:hypothetical protein
MTEVALTRPGAGPVAFLKQRLLLVAGQAEMDDAARGDDAGVDDLQGLAGVAEEDRHGGGNPVQ